MPALCHDDLELLSAEDVERIHRRTDELDLHRDWVIVPLTCADTGMEMVLPDGKVLIRAPGAAGFEPWLEDLRSRLTGIGLSRTPRRGAGDPNSNLSGARPWGTRRYLQRQPNFEIVDEYGIRTSQDDGGLPMDSIRPLHDRVVVERSEAEKKTAGGIVLPDSAKEKPKRGTVVAVGPGRTLESGEVKALDVKKDDCVLFDAYAGSEVKLEGREYLILAEKEILAVIER